MSRRTFQVVLLPEAIQFIEDQPTAVGDKIFYNMHRVAAGEMNSELFSKLGGTEIWEFRTRFQKNAYRLFAFWDTEDETLVVATHGLNKKTQKTPPGEIANAERIMKKYFIDKHKK